MNSGLRPMSPSFRRSPARGGSLIDYDFRSRINAYGKLAKG
jgi:hypothetical protein